MVNPLARVVMSNVAKKANPTSNIGSKNRTSLNLKGLDEIVGEIKGDTVRKKDKVRESKIINEAGSERKVTNLTLKEIDLISNVIKKDVEVKEEKHTATMISLDEAAERIKGSR